MKKYCILFPVFFVLLASCSQKNYELSLEGEWRLFLDSLVVFEEGEITDLEYDQKIILPNTLDKAGIGEPLVRDSTLTREVMTTLSRNFNYVGPAYYSREVQIPEHWSGRRIILNMERIIWKSTVWIDGVRAGSENSLTTPHYYDLSALLTPGKHNITICIDNRRQVNINEKDLAHAYTNHTQIKWNGILGDFSLRALSARSVDDLQIFPDYHSGLVRGNIKISGNGSEGGLLNIKILNGEGSQAGAAEIAVTGSEVEFSLQTRGEVAGWSELQPSLYKLEVTLFDEEGNLLDANTESFGFRNIDKRDGHVVLNDKKIFLRGTLECSIFPLTGHPPVKKDEWMELLLKARNYGLNHLRFHSWCPPAAAFEAADELGFYLQPELPSWSLTYGEEPEVVEFMEAEADRIIKEYGNHPSFMMLCMGNELMGDFDLINGLVKRLKETDPRRLYTATAFTFQQDHWGFHEPYDDFYITQWTDSGWVRGQGVFDQYPPNFSHDYDHAIEHITIPVISHEIGQYSVFPNMAEIDKYTGVLTPLNFMAVRNDLRLKGRLDMAPLYTEATGKFATILYKEEIERAYKTSGLSGFQLLDLHDFPGQGTALVGVLDAFWDSKGFVSGEEFSEFCSTVVPLLWFEKAVYSKSEVFRAEVGISNYHGDLDDVEIAWSARDRKGRLLKSGNFTSGHISHGSVGKVGIIEEPLAELETPEMITIELQLKGTSFKNSWQVWVYDDRQEDIPEGVFVTTSFDEALHALDNGKKVLLSPPLEHIRGITGKFVPVFWSPVHFPNQPGTMGILCDPGHPVFNAFPTEFHSNWQWWDISKFSETVEIDEMDVDPLITVIDNFFKNRALTNLFEAKVGNGSLIFSSIDLVNHIDRRLASSQLRTSILKYMNSEAFDPQRSITRDELNMLYEVSESEAPDVFDIYD